MLSDFVALANLSSRGVCDLIVNMQLIIGLIHPSVISIQVQFTISFSFLLLAYLASLQC